MAAFTSIDAVRRKIMTLQQAAYDAEDRAELLQVEADMERQHREGVNTMEHCWRRLHRKPEGFMNELPSFGCLVKWKNKTGIKNIRYNTSLHMIISSNALGNIKERCQV